MLFVFFYSHPSSRSYDNVITVTPVCLFVYLTRVSPVPDFREAEI